MQALEIKQRNSDKRLFEALQPSNLIRLADSDYLAVRTLAFSGANIFPQRIAHTGAECLEKIMKAFLRLRVKFSAEKIRGLEHNLEDVRVECARIEKFFNNPKLKAFCKNYSGSKKGNEVLRYGFTKTTKAIGLDIKKIIHLVDKFFLGTLLKMDDHHFHAASSQTAALITNTIFSKSLEKIISPPIAGNLKKYIAANNTEIDDFVSKVKEYFEKAEKNESK